MPILRRTRRLALTAFTIAVASTASAQDPQCRQISADVVAFDHAFYNNRFGTLQQGGMMFALRRDVVPVGGSGELRPGYVTLRPGKRPRPMVLRMNVGDCRRFTSQSAEADAHRAAWDATLPPGTRAAGPRDGYGPRAPDADGSWAGANANSLIRGRVDMRFYAEAEVRISHSTAADVGAVELRRQPREVVRR